jgi:hypothetical protein
MMNDDLTRKAERAVARASLELRTAAASHALALSGRNREAADLLTRLRPSSPTKDTEHLMLRYPHFARVAELLILTENDR